MREDLMLTESECATFHTDGIIVLSVPPSVLELQRRFLDEVCLWLAHWGQFETTPENLIADLVIVEHDIRELVARLYRVCRRFASAKRLACHPYFVNVAQTLMKTQLVSCCNFVSVQFDLPYETKFLSHVHQELSLHSRELKRHYHLDAF